MCHLQLETRSNVSHLSEDVRFHGVIRGSAGRNICTATHVLCMWRAAQFCFVIGLRCNPNKGAISCPFLLDLCCGFRILCMPRITSATKGVQVLRSVSILFAYNMHILRVRVPKYDFRAQFQQHTLTYTCAPRALLNWSFPCTHTKLKCFPSIGLLSHLAPIFNPNGYYGLPIFTPNV